VTPHSIFLRVGCALPDSVDPLREPFCEDWAHVVRLDAASLDGMIRRAGWHFMWASRSCSRQGYGWTEERASRRALDRALRGIAGRFNAAEFNSLRVMRFLGFYIANATMEARQIQQNTSLDLVEENLG
jgi:hypothetical protein